MSPIYAQILDKYVQITSPILSICVCTSALSWYIYIQRVFLCLIWVHRNHRFWSNYQRHRRVLSDHLIAPIDTLVTLLATQVIFHTLWVVPASFEQTRLLLQLQPAHVYDTWKPNFQLSNYQSKKRQSWSKFCGLNQLDHAHLHLPARHCVRRPNMQSEQLQHKRLRGFKLVDNFWCLRRPWSLAGLTTSPLFLCPCFGSVADRGSTISTFIPREPKAVASAPQGWCQKCQNILHKSSRHTSIIFETMG